MNKLIYLLLLCVCVVTVNAQMKVGNNPATINANAVLEIESANKGLLIPRMALTSTSSPAPLTAHVAGMLIYNTATGGLNSLLSPGFYYNDGSQWVKVSNQTDPVVVFSVNTNPNTGGTTFQPNVPADPTALYTSNIDGSVWKYSVTYSSYITYSPPSSTAWYLAGGTTDALSNKAASIYRTGSMGIGAKTSADPSAILDVNSTSQGFLPPVMTLAQRSAIATPATGLIVYCKDCNNGGPCLSVNNGTAATPSWDCTSVISASVNTDCGNSTVNGVYVTGIANTASNTVSFKVINNSFSSIGPIDFSTGVTLSGTGAAGLTVGTGTPSGGSGTITGYTIASGGTATLTYLLTGTPTTVGNFTALFSKLGLSCSKTGTVNPTAPVVNCSGQTITGLTPFSYTFNGTTYTAGTISIPYTISSNTAYPAETITSNGLTVSRSAGTFTAPSGVVTYTVSGTYTGTSYLPCTFSANIGGAACTLIVGTSRDFKTGTYNSPNGTYGSCPAVTASVLTDNNYTTGWGSKTTTAGQILQIDLGGTYYIDRIKFGGGLESTCWGGDWTAFDNNAGLLFEYWNGTTWVTLTTTPAAINSSSMTNTSTSIFTLSSIISTSKIRVRSTLVGWCGAGEFYPMCFY